MSIDKALFRQVAGSFASGVTIITTGKDGAFHGMTASAFTSLSIDPMMILVCVDRGADTLAVLQAAGAFNVNILSAEQEPLSRTFASKQAPDSHGMRGVDYRLGSLGIPILNNTLAYIECRTVRELDGGDHIIFLGQVENADFSESHKPLLYYRGLYRHFEALPEETSPGAAARGDLR